MAGAQTPPTARRTDVEDDAQPPHERSPPAENADVKTFALTGGRGDPNQPIKDVSESSTEFDDLVPATLYDSDPDDGFVHSPCEHNPRVATWVPPQSPYNLVEEQLYEDPWKVMVACILLNKTSIQQVDDILGDFFKKCPTAKDGANVDVVWLEKLIHPLGLSNKRSVDIKRFSQEYLNKDWTDPMELHAVGKYASDAYFMFCRGKWRDVDPYDVKLIWYKEWLISKEGLGCGFERSPPPLAKEDRKNAAVVSGWDLDGGDLAERNSQDKPFSWKINGFVKHEDSVDNERKPIEGLRGSGNLDIKPEISSADPFQSDWQNAKENVETGKNVKRRKTDGDEITSSSLNFNAETMNIENGSQVEHSPKDVLWDSE